MGASYTLHSTIGYLSNIWASCSVYCTVQIYTQTKVSISLRARFIHSVSQLTLLSPKLSEDRKDPLISSSVCVYTRTSPVVPSVCYRQMPSMRRRERDLNRKRFRSVKSLFLFCVFCFEFCLRCHLNVIKNRLLCTRSLGHDLFSFRRRICSLLYWRRSL